MLMYTGPMRLHWNKGDTERPWCISLENGWQLEVKSLRTFDVQCKWILIDKITPDEDDGKPRAWIETYGDLEVRSDGHASVYRVQLQSSLVN